MSSNGMYDVIENFGLLYDEIPAYTARRDVAYYLQQAQQLVAPDASILELGSGTGRVLLPLARAGYRVTGLDRSEAMHARCSEKLTSEPDEIRRRVSLVRADMRDFTVPPSPPGTAPPFPLVIAPFRSLQHLTTTREQLRCLSSIRRHMTLGGFFAFDVFNPHFGVMTSDRNAEKEDTPERELPDGRTLRRTSRVTRVRWVEQLSDVEIIYYLRTGTDVRRAVQSFQMRWYTVSELEHLLARAGFRVTAVCGNFDQSPLTDTSPEIVIVAECVA